MFGAYVFHSAVREGGKWVGRKPGPLVYERLRAIPQDQKKRRRRTDRAVGGASRDVLACRVEPTAQDLCLRARMLLNDWGELDSGTHTMRT